MWGKAWRVGWRVGVWLAIAAPAALALDDVPTARLLPDGQVSLFSTLGEKAVRSGVAASVVERVGLTGWLREDFDQLASTLGLDARLLLVKEHGLWPALAVGAEALAGRQPEGREYLAFSRYLGPLDVSAGWSVGRYDGAFAAMTSAFGDEGRNRVVVGLQQQGGGSSPMVHTSLARRWSDRWTAGLSWTSVDGLRFEASYHYFRSSPAARPVGTPPVPPPRRPSVAIYDVDRTLVVDDQAGLVWADLAEQPIGSRTLGLWASKADLLLSDSRYMTIIPVSQGVSGTPLRIDRQKLRLVSYNLASAEEVVADIRPVPPPPQPRPERGWRVGANLRLDVDTPAYGDGVGLVQSNAVELHQPIGWGVSAQTSFEITSLSSLRRYESDHPVRSDRQRFVEARRAHLRHWSLAGAKTGNNWLAVGQVGWIEPQFAGLDGQGLYYHDPANRLSLGVEGSLVWRRQPGSMLAIIRDVPHRSALGIANYAWPEAGTDLTVRAGRFLAGDWGGEVQIAHRWPSGLISQIGLALTAGGGVHEPTGAALRVGVSLPSVLQLSGGVISGRYEARAGDLFGDRGQRLERRVDVVAVHRATNLATALADWSEFSQEVYLPTDANQQNWQQAVEAVAKSAGGGGSLW